MTNVLALSFLAPGRLWLLVAVVALAGVYAALQTRRKKYAVRFTNVDLLDKVAPKRPGWRRHLVAALFLLSGALQIIAFAGPTRTTEVPRERATVMMAIDTSLSMEATDVQPSRILAAKEAAKTFLDQVPPKINVGLVSFNGRAVVRVPPTIDRNQVRTAIDSLTLGEGTAIGEAILAALEGLKAAPADEQGTQPPAVIVLMSDGKTTTGTPDSEAVRLAGEAGVPVSTIAFGTAEGTILLPGSSQSVRVPVDEQALEEIATATSGSFYDAQSAAELREVYRNIGSAVGFETTETEATRIFVGLALAAALLTAALSLTWFSRLP
jgi:Ca-activated chloride channel family protein